jgi:hypothetical protein
VINVQPDISEKHELPIQKMIGDNTPDSTDNEKNIRKQHKLYNNKFDNLDEIHKFLERQNR